jgi:hypothetical protein
MNRGTELMKWNEPRAWLAAARAQARSEGKSSHYVAKWLVALVMVAGTVAYQWYIADTEKRVAPIILALVVIVLFIFLTALAWCSNLLRSTVTFLYQNGILHGPRFSRKWTPFRSIEVFYMEEDEFQSRPFTFLNWQESGWEEESYAVVPFEVDTAEIIALFKSKGIEQAVEINDDNLVK